VSKIVESGGEPPARSVSTSLEARQALYDTREKVHALIRRYDQEAVWDNIQSKDVPAEILDFVSEQLSSGFDFAQVRRQIGIPRSNDKSWKKIMSALRGGFRIDGSALLIQKAYEHETISKKLKAAIDDAFSEGTPMMDSDGNVVKVKGLTKELAAAIDTWGRHQQNLVKMGKDLGAFIDGPDGKQGGSGPAGGVTIQIMSNVQLPSHSQVEVHQAEQRKKNAEILLRAQGKVISEEPEEDDAVSEPEA
jgi:hypothetical protein